jgi:5,10-methylenetetrahydromethanopterin reductase
MRRRLTSVARVGFGFSVTPGEPLGVGAEMARAEALGYDRFGVWDSPALFREPWVTLGSAARDTKRIRLGTWVTNPLSRHPLVTAACAGTVDDLAPGRVYIGIGAGGTGVWHLGMPTAKLAELESYVLAVRSLLVTGNAVWRGHALKMPWAGPRDVPLVMAAHAARSLRLAGRIADGVVIGLGISPDVVAASLETLEAGAREGGRSLDDLEVWFTSFWWTHETPGRAKADGAWSATAFALHFADSGVEHKFIPDELKAPLLEIGKAYDLRTHGHPSEEQKAEYVELADRLGVGDYLRERFMFAGTPDEVEAQIRAAVAAGARNFDGAIDADLPEHDERITKWGSLVLPRFADEPASSL